MKFFSSIEKILETKNPKNKIEMFQDFYDRYKKNTVVFEEDFCCKQFENPSYNDLCSIVPPQVVPKRSNLTKTDGQINLLHAILHIEYSAIDLALDAVYRFHNLPKEYYNDWLEVAEDEIRHFLMLEKLLQSLGASYGDIPVHNALFEASQNTQTLVERMAVVPRYLEANGLDATPMILEKLKKLPPSPVIKDIIENLYIILEEEVDHVRKGDKWFEYACKEDNLSKDIYFEIIQKYYPRGFLRPNNLNINARIAAGFSCKEINFMAKKEVCKME